MFRTITAKYAGSCRRCDGPIYVGQTIRYGGPGRTYHLAAHCAQAAAQGDSDAAAQDAPASVPPPSAAPPPSALLADSELF